MALGAAHDYKDRARMGPLFRLEAEAKGELHHARVPGRADLAYRLRRLRPGRIELQSRVHARKLRVVENVVGFGPQLNAVTLLHNDILKQRHLPVVRSRCAKNQPGHIAEVEKRGVVRGLSWSQRNRLGKRG